ncbi:MAG: type II toxin-antitoxin system Phd/YefM family antitoxin [Candidatus Cloacimonetes bacterium]|nr:type II toxin-antitoxin system Phd/YefM family antitoxin [Candidatus Cloacimonadota bacterium]
MLTLSLNKFRQNMNKVLWAIKNSHEPLYLRERTGEEFVLMSLEDYNSIMETFYLLKTPANAKWLKNSIKQANVGKTIAYKELNEKFNINP